MPRDITQQDIERARAAAERSGDPNVIRLTEQAIKTVTDAAKSH